MLDLPSRLPGVCPSGGPAAGAWFDEERRYRYLLWRRWGNGDAVRFVLLNPSTADEQCDDATLRRCRGLARRWGYDAMLIANLFALRSRHPAALRRAADPVGPANDFILRALIRSGQVVAAWGNGGSLRDRGAVVRAWRQGTGEWWALGLTRTRAPRHPLYTPGSRRFELASLEGLPTED